MHLNILRPLHPQWSLHLSQILDVIVTILHQCFPASCCDLCTTLSTLGYVFICISKPIHWFKNMLQKECSYMQEICMKLAISLKYVKMQYIFIFYKMHILSSCTVYITSIVSSWRNHSCQDLSSACNQANCLADVICSCQGYCGLCCGQLFSLKHLHPAPDIIGVERARNDYASIMRRVFSSHKQEAGEQRYDEEDEEEKGGEVE